MKRALIIFLSLTKICNLFGQIDCGITWPPENSRPDTVSTYVFLTKAIPTKKLTAAQPTSNYSFKTDFFSLVWMPINQKDINTFVGKSLRNISKSEILDTVNCNLLDQNYVAIVTKAKRKRLVFYYLNKSGEQNIFIATIANKRRLKKSMEYIETNL